MEIPIDKNHLEELKKIARPMASSIYGDGERGFNFYEAWDLQEKGEIELPSLVDLLVARTEHYESVGEDKIRDYSEYKAKRNELVGKSLKLGLAGKMDEAAKVLEKQKELDDSFAEIRNQIRCFFSEFLPCWTKDGYGLAKNSQGVETEQFGSIDLVDGRTVPKDSFDLDLGVGFGGTFLRLTGVSFNF